MPSPSWNLPGKTMAKGAADGSGPLLPPPVSPCSAQDGSGQDSAVGSFPLGIQRGNWLHAIPRSMGIICWSLQAAALNQRSTEQERKSSQIECKQGICFVSLPLAPNDCAFERAD